MLEPKRTYKLHDTKLHNFDALETLLTLLPKSAPFKIRDN